MAKGAQDYATGTYILLAAGALMTVIGFLGCCGALRESQCLLGTVRCLSLLAKGDVFLAFNYHSFSFSCVFACRLFAVSSSSSS